MSVERGDIPTREVSSLLIQQRRRLLIQNHIRRPAAGGAHNCRLIACGGGHAPSVPTFSLTPIHGAKLRGVYNGINGNPAPVNVDRPRAPLEDVRRDVRLRQWLAGEDDGGRCGLESGAPAVPLLRGVGGGNSHVVFLAASVSVANTCSARSPMLKFLRQHPR